MQKNIGGSMPDICKCKGDSSTKRVSCYRYRALLNSERQSFYSDSPIDITTQECDRYLHIIYPKKLMLNNKES